MGAERMGYVSLANKKFIQLQISLFPANYFNISLY